jgi:hypothetical protein
MIRVWLNAGHENNCSGFIPPDKGMMTTEQLDWKDGLMKIQLSERRACTSNLPEDIVEKLTNTSQTNLPSDFLCTYRKKGLT